MDQYVGLVALPLTRRPGTYGQVSVMFTTVDMTAKVGIDYTPTSGQVFFADGASAGEVNISLLGGIRRVNPVQFGVNLTTASGFP